MRMLAPEKVASPLGELPSHPPVWRTVSTSIRSAPQTDWNLKWVSSRRPNPSTFVGNQRLPSGHIRWSLRRTQRQEIAGLHTVTLGSSSLLASQATSPANCQTAHCHTKGEVTGAFVHGQDHCHTRSILRLHPSNTGCDGGKPTSIGRGEGVGFGLSRQRRAGGRLLREQRSRRAFAFYNASES